MAVVILGEAAVVDQSHEERGEIGEDLNLGGKLLDGVFEPEQRTQDRSNGRTNESENLVALLFAERLIDAARHRPSRMDPFAGQQLNDALTELAEGHPIGANLRMALRDMQDASLLGIGIHTEQQIRGGEIEEAERVRLDKLRQIQNAPQVRRDRRNLHGEDSVACLRRSDEVT